MTTISENIAGVKKHIQAASNGREVKLLAVSKTFPVESIAEAVRAGQRCFGENYAQEGVAKVEFFKQNYPDIELEWHFIGPLQANKTRLVAEHFQWIESLCRLKIAQRLNDQRPTHMPAINALVEINIDDEDSKSGIAPEALTDFLASVSLLPNIQVRGLMCIPKADADEMGKRQTFARMKRIFDDCRAKGYAFDTLSMGMSADYEVAIEEGSTLVRVGSAIFGARNYSKN